MMMIADILIKAYLAGALVANVSCLLLLANEGMQRDTPLVKNGHQLLLRTVGRPQKEGRWI
jgi:hypothetical protein